MSKDIVDTEAAERQMTEAELEEVRGGIDYSDSYISDRENASSGNAQQSYSNSSRYGGGNDRA
ncbi:MAG: hypothetical protein OXE79_00210 [Acidimicrobiaceae bacterium]|nr:hypothetical protein [Acidimicrobiaceae bacterium]MCY4176009.1 hypothetical protein [Acidimicrobiaceae bacterium]MCY4279857.1 hypothetical protein [Acidimicrobiaceae bacterium]MCY4294748.1 hypothetical protein [Acidimicrobiaceae bacterium]